MMDVPNILGGIFCTQSDIAFVIGFTKYATPLLFCAERCLISFQLYYIVSPSENIAECNAEFAAVVTRNVSHFLSSLNSQLL